jgi:hypothetical protein
VNFKRIKRGKAPFSEKEETTGKTDTVKFAVYRKGM